MNKIILLTCTLIFLASCGGGKKITTRSKTPITTPKRTVVRKETKEVITETPKKEIKKPLATISYKEKIQNYINTYATIAKQEMTTYGIPASITLAQGILESGAGFGKLTSKANNHFGIKCHGWQGEKVYHDDDRSQECFRKYDKASLSFRDHSLFLKNRKRYAKLFTYKQSDYTSWAYGLRAAGYATDKKYPDKLISIIKRYQLFRYDLEVLGKSYTKEKPAISNTKQNEHTVQQGDTLYSIAKKYRLTVSDLKTYNNIHDNTIIVGQILKVVADNSIDDF